MLAPCVAIFVATLGTKAFAERIFLHEASGAYDAFRNEFSSDREVDDELGYILRADLFQRRSEEVRRHNSQPGISWTAAVNEFADYSEEEFGALLGHRRSLSSSGASPASAGSSFLQMEGGLILDSVDWGERLNATTRQAKVQGNCGSCWAISVAGALEAHAEFRGPVRPVSYEQLVDCVANPRECGGQGGCTGATAELAMQYVQDNGLFAQSEYRGYQSGGDGQCRPPDAHPVLTSEGFVRLPSNEYWPLLEAVSRQGPVVVSVDAGKWHMYHKGVFDGCDRDATINHAVLLMGYGSDESLGKDFWLVRNSWGSRWGKRGFIHLLRDAGDDYCGVDRQPSEGVSCRGGPAEMPVCGMCGILADSSYPTGVRFSPRQSVGF